MDYMKDNIKGISGNAFQIGKKGPTIRSGSTTPNNAIGSDGDLYIYNNNSNSATYQRVSGTYCKLLNLGTNGLIDGNDIADSSIDYSKLAAGVFVNYELTNINTVVSTAARIPVDATIPQITEGTQIISMSYAPKKSGNRLLLIANLLFSVSTNANAVGAIFAGSTTNAIVASTIQLQSRYEGTLTFGTSFTASSSASVAYTVRVGASAGNLYVNSFDGTNAAFGGAVITSLEIFEIEV
jgi:hypothetical protein